MKQSEQILFLTKLYHPHVGGVEKHVQKVAGSLISKDFNIIIITEQFEKSLPLIEVHKRLIIYRIPYGRNSFLKKIHIWKWFLLNFDLLRESKKIHVHDIFYWILPFVFFIPKTKIFTTFHGYEGYPFKLKWRILRKMYESLSYGNICVGDFMKRWYGTNPNFIIYGATDDNKSSEIPRKNSIVYFGRLDEQTNVLQYAKTFNLLRGKSKKWNLTVYGDGKYRNSLKKPIKVHPFRTEILNELSKFEFVFVSRYLSMLEAMISKRLVFAYYDNPIKKDYLLDSPFKNHAIIVSSTKELALKLEYYSSHTKEKDKIVEKAYNFAKKQSWEKVGDVYLSLWGFGK